MLTVELKDIFTPSAKGKLLVVTVGNSLRSDDGVGIYIAEQVKKSKKNIIILNADSKPENIIDKAVQIKPQKVVIIDAADFGGRAGEIRLIKKTDIQSTSLSTHSFSLNIIARIIEEDTGAKVFFLGIQPRNVRLGEGLSKSVRKAAQKIISCISSIC
jgi:hydrogenase 3 maturation protease